MKGLALGAKVVGNWDAARKAAWGTEPRRDLLAVCLGEISRRSWLWEQGLWDVGEKEGVEYVRDKRLR